MIKVSNVVKVYKGKGKVPDVVANDGISFELRQGQIIGLLGHNGAGKTTLVNQLIGLSQPDSGNIEILGVDIIKNPKKGRFMCSVQPQTQIPFGELTPFQVVSIMGNIRGGNPEVIKEETLALFKRLDIEEWAHIPGIQLSGGVKRLTAFCMSVINSSNIIILDEPTNDVDPIRRKYLWSEIGRLTKKGKGVLLVTHNITEAENVIDRAIILHKGKIVLDGNVDDIMKNHPNGMRLEITPTSSYSNETPEFVYSSEAIDGKVVLSIEQQRIPEMITWARKQKKEEKIIEYKLSETTLEDIYISITDTKQKEQ